MKWFTNYLNKARQMSDEKRNKEIQEEANFVWQMREYEGKIFICFRDIPVIENGNIERLNEIRNNYIKYVTKNG